MCFNEGSCIKSPKSSSLYRDCMRRDGECRGGQIWAQKVITQNPASFQLHKPQRGRPACPETVMPWPGRCLSPLQHGTTFPCWLFPRSVPQTGPCDGLAAHKPLQEQSPDPTNALAAIPGHCSWCAPRCAYAVKPFSACPVTQEACGKARNITIARKTSWQSCACLNY